MLIEKEKTPSTESQRDGMIMCIFDLIQNKVIMSICSIIGILLRFGKKNKVSKINN
jgi:hypothetical protein